MNVARTVQRRVRVSSATVASVTAEEGRAIRAWLRDADNQLTVPALKSWTKLMPPLRVENLLAPLYAQSFDTASTVRASIIEFSHSFGRNWAKA